MVSQTELNKAFRNIDQWARDVGSGNQPDYVKICLAKCRAEIHAVRSLLQEYKQINTYGA